MSIVRRKRSMYPATNNIFSPRQHYLQTVSPNKFQLNHKSHMFLDKNNSRILHPNKDLSTSILGKKIL